MQQAHSSVPHQIHQQVGTGHSERYPSGETSVSSGLDTTFFLGTARSRVVWHMPPSLRDIHSRERWPHLTQNTLLADLLNLGVQWSLQTIDSVRFSSHLHMMLDRLMCSNLSLRRVLPTIEATARELQNHRKSDVRAQVNLEAAAIRTKIIASLSQDPAKFFNDNSQDLPDTHWSDIFFRKLWNNLHIRSVLTSATGSVDDLQNWFQGAIREFCSRPEISQIMSASESEQFLKVTTSAAREAGLFNEKRIAKACVLELARCSAFSSYVRQEIHDVLAHLFVRARTGLLSQQNDEGQKSGSHKTEVEEHIKESELTSSGPIRERKTFVDLLHDAFSSIRRFFSRSSAATGLPRESTQPIQGTLLSQVTPPSGSLRYDDREWRLDELSLQQEPSTPLMRRLREEAIASIQALADNLFASKHFQDLIEEAVVPVQSARYEAVVRKARGIARDHLGPYISNYSRAQLASDLDRGLLSEHSRAYLNDRFALSWYSYEHTRHMHWQRYPENFTGPLNALFNLFTTSEAKNRARIYGQIEQLVLEIPHRRQERSEYLTRLAHLLPPESERRTEFEWEARANSNVRGWARTRLYPPGRESFVRQQIANRLMPYLLASESPRAVAVKNAVNAICDRKVTESFVQSRFPQDSVDAAKQRICSEIAEAFFSESNLTTRTHDFLDNLLGVVIEEELIRRTLSLVQKHGGNPIPQGETSKLARGVFSEIFNRHVLADLDVLQGFLVLSLDQQAQGFAESFLEKHYPDPLKVYLSLSPSEQQEEFRRRLRREGLLKDDAPAPTKRIQPDQRHHSWLRHFPGFNRLPSWISSS